MAARNVPYYVLLRTDSNGTIIRGGEDKRKNYTIRDVEFCYEPLENVEACSLFSSVTGGRAVPSRHHRFIHFSAISIDPRDYSNGMNEVDTSVWGTVEHLNEGVVCKLYENEGLPDRDYKVHEDLRGVSGTHCTIEGLLNVRCGPYNQVNNNCIHFVVRCWNVLQAGNTVGYDDVTQAFTYG